MFPPQYFSCQPVILIFNISYSEFEEVLAALNWPFVSSAVPMPPPPAQQAELKERVEILFGQLVKLQLPYPLECPFVIKPSYLTFQRHPPLVLNDTMPD